MTPVPPPTPVPPDSKLPPTPALLLYPCIRVTPESLLAVQNYLDHDEISAQCPSRFKASAIGWLIAGAHNDGNHHIPRDSFHPPLAVLRESCVGWDNYNFRRDLLLAAFDAVSPAIIYATLMIS